MIKYLKRIFHGPPAHETPEKYETMFNLSQDMICLAKGNKFIDVNKAWENTLGYSREYLLSIEWKSLIHPDDLESTKEASDLVEKGEALKEFQNRYRDSKGIYHYLSWTAISKDGISYATARDETKRVMLEDQLRRMNKELEEFAYVASHDLKSPLRAITNLAEWVMEDLDDKTLPESTRKHLRLIQERITRMNDLIEGVLRYSRVGRVYNTNEEINLNELVETVILKLDKKDFVFEIDFLPVIKANKILIWQLFYNIIHNCIIHHNRKDGKVDINFKDFKTYYEFTVTDDGPGIHPSFKGRMFGLFQAFSSTNNQSTGLGLALCKKIIEYAGGKIWSESEYGKGTKIIFTWSK